MPMRRLPLLLIALCIDGIDMLLLKREAGIRHRATSNHITPPATAGDVPINSKRDSRLLKTADRPKNSWPAASSAPTGKTIHTLAP